MTVANCSLKLAVPRPINANLNTTEFTYNKSDEIRHALDHRTLNTCCMDCNMDWSNELVAEFLHLYEQQPIIWNSKHERHKDRNAVYNAWKEIEMKFSINYSLKSLKKKKDALMATYRKLHRKVKSSMKTGSGADEVFKPDWFAYEQMAKFLQSVYIPRITKSSEIAADIEDDETETQSLTSESTSSLDSFKIPANVGMISNKKQKDEKKSNTEKRMGESYHMLKIMSEKPDSDECSLYTELLCKKLRALNNNTREIAMYEIDNIMYRLKQQQNRPPSQSSLAQIQNFQYSIQQEVHHHNPPYLHSHTQSLPRFPPSPHSHSQPSSEFPPFPQSYSQPSPHSHSQPSPGFPPFPHSHSQPSSGFPPFPQSYSQPSPHSHSQPSRGFPTSPYSHSQPSPGFLSSQSYSQPSSHSHSQPSSGFLSSSQSYSQPSPHSHSQPSSGFPTSPYSHSQLSPGFPSSPYSHSQPSSDDMLQGNRDNNETTDICLNLSLK